MPRFERVVVDSDFPGGYQVEVADINGDSRLDIIGVGEGTCAWFENPTWKKRVVSTPRQTPGIISSASADLDGDGKAEIAIAYEFGMNDPTHGKLVLAAQGPDSQAAWTLRPIADVGSIHRLRWGDVDGDKRLDLVVAPLFGPTARALSYNQSPARLLVFQTGSNPKAASWTAETLGERPVIHGIKVLDFNGDGRSEVLTADNLGVAVFDLESGTGKWRSRTLVSGAPGEPPKRGSSEVQVGHLADGTRFLATVDPWHGTEVAVSESAGPASFGPRSVLDATMKDGHALWVADVDGDGDDEIFAGYRGPGTSVLAFDYDGKSWIRTVLDSAIAAQDLRGGDLDGDGTPDVVSIGGKTHNLVWYRPLQPNKP
ncbi:MAG TPA: VCBS repeat-containing protein [Isosphaeraceae bacterium]|nr:VCBS repeat-containing protein [Isosphaeraceae bacterium]